MLTKDDMKKLDEIDAKLATINEELLTAGVWRGAELKWHRNQLMDERNRISPPRTTTYAQDREWKRRKRVAEQAAFQAKLEKDYDADRRRRGQR